MSYDFEEVLETIKMTEIEHFDIRTVTMGISLRDCSDRNLEVVKQKYMKRFYVTEADTLNLPVKLKDNMEFLLRIKEFLLLPFQFRLTDLKEMSLLRSREF